MFLPLSRNYYSEHKFAKMTAMKNAAVIFYILTIKL